MSDRFEGATREMAGRAQQTIGETVGDTKMQAAGFTNRVSGRLQQARGQARDASEQVYETIRAQPLTAALVALGVGFLIGRLTWR